jgi:hypothetical protein
VVVTEPTSDQPTPDQPTSDQPTPDQPTSDQPTSDQPAGALTACSCMLKNVSVPVMSVGPLGFFVFSFLYFSISRLLLIMEKHLYAAVRCMVKDLCSSAI